MAKLRRLGEIAQMYLQNHLRNKAAEQNARFISERQTEQAYLDDYLQRSRSMDEDYSDMFSSAAKDPALALRLSRSSHPEFRDLAPNDNEMGAEVSKSISGAQNEFQLPTPEDVINQRRAVGPIEDLGGITGLLQQRNARENEFGLQRESEMDRAFATAQGEAYNTGMGQEQALAENHPAVLGREKLEGEQENQLRLGLEKSLTPIMVNRAGQTAGATTTANLTAQANFQDPSLDPLAHQIMDNPDLLTQINPENKFKLLKRMSQIGLESPTVATRSTQHMIEDAEHALDIVTKNQAGLEGRYGVPSLSDPGSLTRMIPGAGGAASGSAAADFGAAVESLVASLTLPRLQVMRGFGHLSDNDMKVLTAAGTRLQGRLSDKAAQNELAIVRQVLDTARQRAGLPARQDMVGGNNPVLESGRSKLEMLRNAR